MNKNEVDKKDREQIMALMVQIKSVVLFSNPHHAIVALARMTGFMMMVAGEGRQLDKDEFYPILIGEVDDAYDSALATRVMAETIDKMTGDTNE